MARTSVPAESPAHPYRLPSHGRALPMAQSHDCVTALRALGEETRVRIIGLLLDHARDVSGISDALGVSPYNVSKHLRVLREAGLLQVEKDGRQRLYALPDAIRREAAAGRILDLGCCTFQFEADVTAASTRAGEGGGRPRRPGARAGRAPRSAGRTSR